MATRPAFDQMTCVPVFGVPVYFRLNCLVYVMIAGCLPRLLDRPWWNFWTAAYVGVASVLLLVAHELGHAWAARLNGCKVNRVIISGGGGMCFAALPSTSWGRILYFSGGIAGQALVAVLAITVLLARTHATEVDDASRFIFIYVNCLYIAINAIPIKNLDGMQIFKELVLIRRLVRQSR